MKPFFTKDVEITEEARQKFFSTDLTKEFSLLKTKFILVDDFKALKIEEAFRQAVLELGITAKQLIHPLRVALSGRTVGPGMFEFIEVLGKERTLERIDRIIASFTNSI